MSLDRVKERLGEQMRKVYKGPQPLVYGNQYNYVLGFTKEKNKKVFWGPMTEEEAYSCLTELNEGELFKLTTRDPHRAVREVRDILVKRGEKPDDVLKKLLHKREDASKAAPVAEKPSILRRLLSGGSQLGMPKGITRATPPPKFIVKRVMKSGGM